MLVGQDGQPKLSDFGLAKRIGDESSQTHAGSVVGTPSYMSPEQAEGQGGAVGPLSDVYSLGAILYELLTGRAPFKAARMLDTLDLVRRQEPLAPSQLQPGTPTDLETICLKCLQKDPRQRYGSAAELAADLGRYLAGEPVRARPVPVWERGWRWCRRNPVVAGLSTLVVVLFIIAFAGSLVFGGIVYHEKNATERARHEAEANLVKATENAAVAQHNMAKAVQNAQLVARTSSSPSGT